MRPSDANSLERQMALFKRHMDAGSKAGLIRVRIEDERLDPGYITVDGRRVVNFGSCAYLGLSHHPRLVKAATDAIQRFGTVYSSSPTYSALGLYSELEAKLREVVSAHVVVAPTTTLGHLAALPALIGVSDVVLIDKNAHASVHLATRVLAADGIPILGINHNDLVDLEAHLVDTTDRYRHVWYLADGVYSMFGDVAPIAQLHGLLARYPNLHMYIDDAHGFGWKGRHGSGWVLSEMPWHPRLVLAFGFSKSWTSGGAAIAFADEAMATRVLAVGGTLTFGGPLHPAQLGAAIAAADIHLSSEYLSMQSAFLGQIDFVAKALIEARLPVASFDPTPLWFVKVGSSHRALELSREMLKRGFYTNFAAFPAVPINKSGLRFMNTLSHSNDQILELIGNLAELLPEHVGEPEIEIDLTQIEAPNLRTGPVETS